jgi:putative endonuclease
VQRRNRQMRPQRALPDRYYPAGGTGQKARQLRRADLTLIAKIAMAREQHPDGAPPAKTWQVYIVRCQDGSYYTGITTDLARRIAEHNSAAGGARYTRPRQPVSLVYAETAPDRSAACRREYQLRRLTPAMKRALISRGAPLREAPRPREG